MTKHHKSLDPSLSYYKALSDDTLEFVISHEAPDLAGDIVVQKGIRAISDRIPAQVDHSGKMADTIGSWSNIRTNGSATTATLNLVKRGVSPMADLVRGLAEAGVKLAASIGFTSPKVEPIKGGGFKFLESVLHEVSVVVTPCQPLATQIAKSFGLEAVIAPEPDTAVSGSLPTETINRAKAAILAANRAARK